MYLSMFLQNKICEHHWCFASQLIIRKLKKRCLSYLGQLSTVVQSTQQCSHILFFRNNLMYVCLKGFEKKIIYSIFFIFQTMTDCTRTWRKHWCGIYKQKNCNKYSKERFVTFLYIWALILLPLQKDHALLKPKKIMTTCCQAMITHQVEFMEDFTVSLCLEYIRQASTKL